MRTQSGFTLIELVMVIVILGILAATAIPKYVDLSGEAEEASFSATIGSLKSAAATTYAKAKLSASDDDVTLSDITANLDYDDDKVTITGTDATCADVTVVIGTLSEEIDLSNFCFDDS